MGGHVYRAASGELVQAIVGSEFDIVVSLYHRDGHSPADGVSSSTT